MSTKTAFLALTILFIAGLIGVGVLYSKKLAEDGKVRPASEKKAEVGSKNNLEKIKEDEKLNSVIEKKKARQQLTPEEQAILDKIIADKTKQKAQQLKQEASSRSYTQDELNYIANPKKNIENELGIGSETSSTPTGKPLTQDELLNMAGKKKN
jgi:hypothetical protein